MTRWHTIIVTDRRWKLHTFDYVPRIQDQEQNVEHPRLAWHHRAIVDGAADSAARAGKSIEIWQPGMSPMELSRRVAPLMGYRRYLPQTFNHVPLEDISERLDIAEGFSPTGQTLAVILDALRVRDTSLSIPRRSSTVELSDLNAVVTEFGNKIGQLNSLSPEKRRRAEPALYKLISQRCAID